LPPVHFLPAALRPRARRFRGESIDLIGGVYSLGVSNSQEEVDDQEPGIHPAVCTAGINPAAHVKLVKTILFLAGRCGPVKWMGHGALAVFWKTGNMADIDAAVLAETALRFGLLTMYTLQEGWVE